MSTSKGVEAIAWRMITRSITHPSSAAATTATSITTTSGTFARA